MRRHKRADCKDCGINTLENGEYYMLKDDVWELGNLRKGMLCIGCFESRIKRKLTKEDFIDAPLNELVCTDERLLDLYAINNHSARKINRLSQPSI